MAEAGYNNKSNLCATSEYLDLAPPEYRKRAFTECIHSAFGQRSKRESSVINWFDVRLGHPTLPRGSRIRRPGRFESRLFWLYEEALGRSAPQLIHPSSRLDQNPTIRTLDTEKEREAGGLPCQLTSARATGRVRRFPSQAHDFRVFEDGVQVGYA